MAGLQAAVDDRPDLVVLDLGLPDLDGVHAAADAARRQRRAGHRRDRPRRRGRDRPRARRRRRRLRRQALRRRAPRRPDPRGAAPRPTRPDAPRRWSVGGLRVDPRAREAHARRRRAGADAGSSSTCSRTSPRGPATWSPSGSCSPRCGTRPYGGADKTVDVHLSWLRRKLGESAAAPRYLHSVRGVGVKLVRPDGPVVRRQLVAARRRPPRCWSSWRSCCRWRCCCARSPPTGRSRRRSRRRRASRCVVAVSDAARPARAGGRRWSTPAARATVTVYLPDGTHARRAAPGRLDARWRGVRPVLHRRRRRRARGAASRSRPRPAAPSSRSFVPDDAAAPRRAARPSPCSSALGAGAAAGRGRWSPTGWPAAPCGRSPRWPTRPAGSAEGDLTRARRARRPAGGARRRRGGQRARPPHRRAAASPSASRSPTCRTGCGRRSPRCAWTPRGCATRRRPSRLRRRRRRAVERTVDEVIRGARRPVRRGRARRVRRRGGRARSGPRSGRCSPRTRAGRGGSSSRRSALPGAAARPPTSPPPSTRCSATPSRTRRRRAAVDVRVGAARRRGARVEVADRGPGPAARCRRARAQRRRLDRPRARHRPPHRRGRPAGGWSSRTGRAGGARVVLLLGPP